MGITLRLLNPKNCLTVLCIHVKKPLGLFKTQSQTLTSGLPSTVPALNFASRPVQKFFKALAK